MRENNIFSKRRIKFKSTTKAAKNAININNILNRNFVTDTHTLLGPPLCNKVFLSDFWSDSLGSLQKLYINAILSARFSYFLPLS